MFDKTLDRKLQIEQHEPTKSGANSGTQEGQAAPALLVAPVLPLLLKIQWDRIGLRSVVICDTDIL